MSSSRAAPLAVGLLCAVVFLVSLGYGSGLPLVQIYLGRYLARPDAAAIAWHVGMLGGTYTFALFVFAPWWGRRSDRHGRMPVLAVGFATYLVGTAMAAVAPNLAAVYMARLLAGAGAAAIMPAAQAFIADISDAEARSRRFVLLGSAVFLGFLTGPAFGSWVAGPLMRMSLPQMPGMVNWPALAVALAGVPLLVVLRSCLAGVGKQTSSMAPRRSSIFRRRFVVASMVLAFFSSFAAGTFEVGFSLFGGQTLGLPSRTIAVMYIACSLAMLAAQSLLLVPSLRDRLNQRWLAGAFAGSAVALGFTSVVPDAASLALLIGIVGTGVGMVGPVLAHELLERDRSAAGEVLGRQAAAGNLGQAIGSVMAGGAFALHPLAPFWLAAFGLVLGASATLRWWGPAREEQARTGLRRGEAHEAA